MCSRVAYIRHRFDFRVMFFARYTKTNIFTLNFVADSWPEVALRPNQAIFMVANLIKV